MEQKNLFKKAEQLKKQLLTFPPFTEGEVDALREEFILRFTYNSNAIEGSALSLHETALVLREGLCIGGKSLREYIDAVGHRDACLYVGDLVRNKIELSEKIIKDIHSLVLMGCKQDAGMYRRLPVAIIGIQAGLPPSYLVPKEMEMLLKKYYSEMPQQHPIERAATFHLMFENIHPFTNGNGRTGRLIMNLELMKEGYPPIDVKFIDRNKYMNAFKMWYKEKSAEAMIELVGGYVVERLEEYIQLLKVANDIRPV